MRILYTLLRETQIKYNINLTNSDTVGYAFIIDNYQVFPKVGNVTNKDLHGEEQRNQQKVASSGDRT